jgi:hypothetical protein
MMACRQHQVARSAENPRYIPYSSGVGLLEITVGKNSHLKIPAQSR